MSAFEFFFSFYGLLLGLSVAELVGGLARVLHERSRIRFGLLTPLLALFVAFDIATFWNQAWVIFRNAPFNLALLVVGLAVAAVFYIAASIIFPRLTDERDTTRVDLDDHFWAQRRLVFACVLIANLIIGGVFFTLLAVNGEWGRLPLGALFWVGLAVFIGGCATAAVAPRGRIAVAALIVLVSYHAFTFIRVLWQLINDGGWSLISPAAG